MVEGGRGRRGRTTDGVGYKEETGGRADGGQVLARRKFEAGSPSIERDRPAIAPSTPPAAAAGPIASQIHKKFGLLCLRLPLASFSLRPFAMPKAPKALSKAKHDPLHVQLGEDEVYAKYGRVSQPGRRRKSRAKDDDETGEVCPRPTRPQIPF